MRYKKTEKRLREIGPDLGARKWWRERRRADRSCASCEARRHGSGRRCGRKPSTVTSPTCLRFSRRSRSALPARCKPSSSPHPVDLARCAVRRPTRRLRRLSPWPVRMEQRDADGLPQEHRALWERAIARDPTFRRRAHRARGCVAVARLLAAIPFGCRACAHSPTRALSLDPVGRGPRRARVHHFRFDGLLEAERLFARAMQLGRTPRRHTTIGELSCNMGRLLKPSRRASGSIELDPLWSARHPTSVGHSSRRDASQNPLLHASVRSSWHLTCTLALRESILAHRAGNMRTRGDVRALVSRHRQTCRGAGGGSCRARTKRRRRAARRDWRSCARSLRYPRHLQHWRAHTAFAKPTPLRCDGANDPGHDPMTVWSRHVCVVGSASSPMRDSTTSCDGCAFRTGREPYRPRRWHMRAAFSVEAAPTRRPSGAAACQPQLDR